MLAAALNQIPKDSVLSSKIDELELRLLLEAIFHQYSYDFRGYSLASLKRRMTQALARFHCETISELQNQLLHDKLSFSDLLPFMTVQVSELFRDPGYFKTLREKVVPHLQTYPSLKVWIPGCADGEEVYSLVILFREMGLEDRTIFYATDISSDALEKAEAGHYGLDRIPLFTKNHQLSGGKGSLSDFYTAAYGRAIFDRTLRRRVVFSDHSLSSDSAFAEVQLISCRNTLIYFRRELQDRAVGLFKESLPRNGFLGLGGKESLRFSKHEADFMNFDLTHRIYRRVGGL